MNARHYWPLVLWMHTVFHQTVGADNCIRSTTERFLSGLFKCFITASVSFLALVAVKMWPIQTDFETNKLQMLWIKNVFHWILLRFLFKFKVKMTLMHWSSVLMLVPRWNAVVCWSCPRDSLWNRWYCIVDFQFLSNDGFFTVIVCMHEIRSFIQ